MFQGTKFQVQMLKPCKFVQKSNEEVLDFKTWQLVMVSNFRCLILDNSLLVHVCHPYKRYVVLSLQGKLHYCRPEKPLDDLY